ncbi:MAG: GMC oxidoreductase [Gemmatimonadota bacterium]
MADFLVVGSGASGVHFAQSMLEAGRTVEMLDVGFEKPDAVHPGTNVLDLKEVLTEPEEYFLGQSGEAVVYPGPAAKPYGFPPGKAYVFRKPAAFEVEGRGFAPLLSFATGGLAEAWTGGCYELADEELALFPFSPSDLRQGYRTVAARIGIGAAEDDLLRFSPLTAGYLTPLEADLHSQELLDRYTQKRDRINAIGAWIGRSRVAVLSHDQGERQSCTHLGRCLLGCPRQSLYAPSHTLHELLHNPLFTYRRGVLVTSLALENGRVRGVVAKAAGDNGPAAEGEIRAGRVVLAAGAVASSKIVLATRLRRGEPHPVLEGLMDNTHAMIPFVNLARVGRAPQLAHYQFHQLALGLENPDWKLRAHGQITTLKAAATHPVVTALPFDMKTSLAVFRRIRGALGVVNLWLADSRHPSNRLSLDVTPGAAGGPGGGRLILEYGTDSRDRTQLETSLRNVRAMLRHLGCLAPRSMTAVLPRGSSVHYAGTLPMSREDREYSTRADGSIRGLDGACVVDGSTFPWLPAKNITFSLMANAVRTAEALSG